jgi:hypothetical protein
MPKLNNLTDVQISSVLSWLRKNFENNAITISSSEVKELRGK